MPRAITRAGVAKVAWLVPAKVAWLVPAKAGKAGLAARYVKTQTYADGWLLLSHTMRHRLANATDMTCTAKRDADETPPVVNRAAEMPPAITFAGIAKVAGSCRSRRSWSRRQVCRDPRPTPMDGCFCPAPCVIVSLTRPT